MMGERLTRSFCLLFERRKFSANQKFKLMHEMKNGSLSIYVNDGAISFAALLVDQMCKVLRIPVRSLALLSSSVPYRKGIQVQAESNQ